MLDNPRTFACTFAAMYNDHSLTLLTTGLYALGALVVVGVSLESVQA